MADDMDPKMPAHGKPPAHADAGECACGFHRAIREAYKNGYADGQRAALALPTDDHFRCEVCHANTSVIVATDKRRCSECHERNLSGGGA